MPLRRLLSTPAAWHVSLYGGVELHTCPAGYVPVGSQQNAKALAEWKTCADCVKNAEGVTMNMGAGLLTTDSATAIPMVVLHNTMGASGPDHNTAISPCGWCQGCLDSASVHVDSGHGGSYFRGVKFANTTQMQLRSLLLRQLAPTGPATY